MTSVSNKTSKKNYTYDKSSYDDTYSDVKVAFKLVGLRITCEDSKAAKLAFLHVPNKFQFTMRLKLGWTMFYWFEFLNNVLVPTLEIAGAVIYGKNSIEDQSVIFRMIPCACYTTLANLKTIKLFRYQRICENLINELRAMWTEGDVTEEEHLTINKALRTLKFISKGYYWCNNILASSYVVPGCISIIWRMFGRDYPKTLPFTYWLPFDPYQSGVYEIMLLVQAWHTGTTLWFFLSGDLLFCIFMSHITTQFDLLAIRIRKLIYVPIDKQLIKDFPLGDKNLWTIEERERLVDALECKQYRELTKIIRRHQDLIRLSNDVEMLFSFAFCINFLITSAIICTCGFCCLIIEKWNKITYKLFLVSSLSQTWLICWYGQKLIDSSTSIADALYNSGWYMGSKRIRSTMIILIQRAQKRVKITTWGFSTISLVSYTTIIKTAWSYFTLLLKMYK